MHVNKSYSNCLQVGFVCLGVLASLDVVMLLNSEDYRNVLGRGEGLFSGVNIGRMALSLGMVAFYGMQYVKIRNGCVSSSVLVCHGLLYGLLGVGLFFVPFGGFLLAPLTPVGVLYLGAIAWTPFQLPGSLGVAAAFVAFNAYLVGAGLTLGKRAKEGVRLT